MSNTTNPTPKTEFTPPARASIANLITCTTNDSTPKTKSTPRIYTTDLRKEIANDEEKLTKLQEEVETLNAEIKRKKQCLKKQKARAEKEAYQRGYISTEVARLILGLKTDTYVRRLAGIDPCPDGKKRKSIRSILVDDAYRFVYYDDIISELKKRLNCEDYLYWTRNDTGDVINELNDIIVTCAEYDEIFARINKAPQNCDDNTISQSPEQLDSKLFEDIREYLKGKHVSLEQLQGAARAKLSEGHRRALLFLENRGEILNKTLKFSLDESLSLRDMFDPDNSTIIRMLAHHDPSRDAGNISSS